MNLDVSAVLIAIVLGVTIIVNIILYRKDRQKQAKIDTARIYLDSVNFIKTSPHILITMDALQKNSNVSIDSIHATSLLSFYEFVAILWNGKTFDDTYAKALFKDDFTMIKQNDSLMTIAKSTQEQSRELAYPNLNKCLKKY